MKYLGIILFFLMASVTAFAQELPSFPGAEGHGRYTIGGRGGTVYRVTSLEDTNTPGTLRYAATQKGPRTIVFDVSGTIFLKSDLKVSNDYITIAGQTAPGQGICIADYAFIIAANEVIIRYVRFRPGNKSAIENELEPDGLGGMDRKNIIIDHCSVSWSVDECLSVYGCENLTVQWCIVSESLRHSGHSKGAHGYGGNWGGNKATYHHNLMAHHASRAPRLGPRAGTQENEYVDYRNNVIYNWAGNGCYGGEGMKINIVDNYYKPGPATPNSAVRYRIAKIGIRTEEYCNTYPAFAPMKHVWGKYYVNGNVVEGNAEVTSDNWTKGIYAQINNNDCDGLFTDVTRDTIRLNEPLETNVITKHTAQRAFRQVLRYAGASLDRDIIDHRIVQETEYGTYTYKGSVSGALGLIDTQDDVKPNGALSAWPELSDRGVTAEQLLDSDGDGMPDYWEIEMGLNPFNAADGKIATLSAEGYTNLEVYMNSLVAEITAKQNEFEDGDSGEGEGDDNGPLIEVYVNPSNLVSYFDAVNDGTVLVLEEGVYTQKISIPSNRTVTLKAAEGAQPVLKFTSEISASSGESNGSLIFDGLTIDPASVNYFISLKGGSSLKSLQFRNCYITSSKRGLMTITEGGLNGELIIDNSIFELSKCESYSYIYNDGGATAKVRITNSTFYNYPQEHMFWTRRYGKAYDFDFTFANNTVYHWAKSGKAYSICRMEETGHSVATSYIFRDNIIDNGIDTTTDLSMLYTTGGGSLLAENNLLVGVNGYTGTNLTYIQINDLALGEGILSDLTTIDFSDPENGEFYILSTSPLATASTTGGLIGDMRWLEIVEDGTGIESVGGVENAPVVYANANQIIVEGLSPNSIVEVYTINGLLQDRKNTNESNISFYVPQGVYIIRVVEINRTTAKKVVCF